MIATAHLFGPLNDKLIELLSRLTAAEWELPTVAGRWRVKDVAAHLLDGMWRRLSAARDGHLLPPSRPIESPREFVAFIDELNADWVKAARRLSPRILVEQLEVAGGQLAKYFLSLDPAAKAFWPVTWAGEQESLNWMDVGREYTEGWHHQQQIRLATGRRQLLDRHFGYPALALFAQALPLAYSHAAAPEGAEVEVTISGEAGAIFTLRRRETDWSMLQAKATAPVTKIVIRDADAWLLFTKGLRGEAAAAAVESEGDASLVSPFLRTLSVIG
jgi:uncharacterized protein (TIGR03083 family)